MVEAVEMWIPSQPAPTSIQRPIEKALAARVDHLSGRKQLLHRHTEQVRAILQHTSESPPLLFRAQTFGVPPENPPRNHVSQQNPFLITTPQGC